MHKVLTSGKSSNDLLLTTGIKLGTIMPIMARIRLLFRRTNLGCRRCNAFIETNRSFTISIIVNTRSWTMVRYDPTFKLIYEPENVKGHSYKSKKQFL